LKIFYTFPDKSTFQDIYEDDKEESLFCDKPNGNNLKSCGVGYRASYMKKASQIFTLSKLDPYRNTTKIDI
jgi:hypothetical protein